MRQAATRSAFTLIELLVIIAIVGLLLGLLVPAVQKVRESANRSKCQNNLRQIGLALHAFADANDHLPAGCSYLDGSSPEPHMSWLCRLLPFVEQPALWEGSVTAFRQEPFFERAPHLTNLRTVVAIYVCPSDGRAARTQRVRGLAGPIEVAFTSYLGVAGSNHRAADGVLFLDSRVRFADVTDGTTTTVFVGERPPNTYGDFGWWYAGWGQSKDGSGDSTLGTREICDYPPYSQCGAGPFEYQSGSAQDPCSTFHFWSLHPGGGNFIFGDGSVRFLAYHAKSVLPLLGTRSGGETVSMPE